MTAYIGDAPDMDVYAKPIKAAAGAPVDLRALNLRDAAEHRAAEAKKANPHYKRHGEIDILTGKWHSYTAEELAEQKWARTERRHLIGLVCVVAACFIGAMAIVIAYRAGWLS